jgi:predicted kinase
MRKWMRERLQRRKKTPEKSSEQPAPPPLQPAYFDAAEASDEAPHGERNIEAEAEIRSENKKSDNRDAEVSAAANEAPAAIEARPSRIARPRAQRPPAEAQVDDEVRPSTGATTSSSGRGRRRRGGRGRGGRGREQAVAQAFAPAAVKGSIPVLPAEPEEEQAPDAVVYPGAEAEAREAEGGAKQPVTTSAPKAPAAVVVAQRPPKGVVVLAIGLPGSGKSTWFKRHSVVPLSSDMVRTLLFDDVREQRFQDLVFSNLRSMLKARLIAKRPMNYVDATNLTPQERQHWIKLAKDYQYEVQAVFFDVPLQMCIERHERRDRVVPEDVMRRMAAKLKPPTFEEGFAKITVVRVKKKDAGGDLASGDVVSS